MSSGQEGVCKGKTNISLDVLQPNHKTFEKQKHHNLNLNGTTDAIIKIKTDYKNYLRVTHAQRTNSFITYEDKSHYSYSHFVFI